jgi:hypothetical protein
MIGSQLSEALEYLSYHAPDEDATINHENVNNNFRVLVENIWDSLPEGPGKTVAIRAIGAARMECNSVIANKGA